MKKEEKVDAPINLNNLDIQKAAEYYRKITNVTSYQGFFGKYHDLTAGDAEILKYKKFSELKFSSILTQ